MKSRNYIFRIRKQKSFNYPLFCSYIVHIDMLEEFAYFASCQDFNLILSVVPASQGGQNPVSSRRVGTRGANRGEKEEIKSAIKRQVLRSYEKLEEVVIGFFENH